MPDTRTHELIHDRLGHSPGAHGTKGYAMSGHSPGCRERTSGGSTRPRNNS